MKNFVVAAAMLLGLSAAMAQTPPQDGRAQNEIIVKANAAQAARNWPEVEKLAKQLIAMAPDQWEYLRSLADAQSNQGHYKDALASYERGIALAEKTPSAATDPRMKAALAAMWTQKGNMLLKLKSNAAAVAAFETAARLDPHPAVAYFNLCATMYNTGNVKGALASCDKAIAADPKKADAYFIKGSLLIGDATVDAKGNMVAPPGTVPALRKYLELAPNGPHVADVKEMLKVVGQPVTTTYQPKK